MGGLIDNKRLHSTINASNCFSTDYNFFLPATLYRSFWQRVISSIISTFIIMKDLKNKVQVIGTVGCKPRILRLVSGKTLASFVLAEIKYEKESVGKFTTNWYNIIAWDNIADVIDKHVKNGCEVAVEGKLVTHTLLDRHGNKKYTSEIVVHELLILNSDN